MSIRNALKKAVEDNTEGDSINIKQTALDLGCSFGERFSDSIDKGRIIPVPNDAETLASIELNMKNTRSENNTIVALLLAKFILMLESGILREDRCDVFFLSEMRFSRTSAQMLLATRLAIPESIISQLDSLHFDTHNYAAKNKLMHKFVNSAFYISDSQGFFGILNKLEIGFSSRMSTKSLPPKVIEASKEA